MSRRKYTDEQIIDALEKHGSNRKAAASIGMDYRGFMRRKKSLPLRGYSPKHHLTEPVPDAFELSAYTLQYNLKTGKPEKIWLKPRKDAEVARAMMEAMLDGLCAEVPRVAPVRAPAATVAELMNCYVVTDYHLGMLAWAPETGAHWDTEIAEEMLVSWFARALHESPRAEVGVFAQLGDFLHWDGWDAVTPTSRHLLDADTRFPRLVEVAVRAVKRIIQMMLERHQRVHVVMAEGNHDLTSSVWLRELCAAMFENEPRVIVDKRPDPYYCVTHGKTTLFFHHGHKKKLESLDDVFVSKFRKEFAGAENVYAHTGHLHHSVVKETNLMKLEQHRTLAAPDAHASRGGWISGREACVITYCKEYGERSRIVIPAKLVTDDLRAQQQMVAVA